MKQLKAILIGAGGRGKLYTDIMAEYPDKYKVIGVAEPLKERREYIQNKHNIDASHCFESWEEMLSAPKFADVALICSMDRLHCAHAVAALKQGYDLLLEKPVAATAEDCATILKAAKKYDRKVLVCHTMRYEPFWRTLKALLNEGKIGDIMSVEHIETVGPLLYTHAFVRGNWNNSETSSFMLLQKCSHDLDMLGWLMGEDCKRIHSFGSLSHFRRENAPEGSPERCIEGCPVGDTCPHNAMKIYYDDKRNHWVRGVAASLPSGTETDCDVLKAMHTTEYGKCVYKCSNNVVDHQTVNMEFESGATVTLNMTAFAKQTALGSRRIRVMGTKGDLIGDFGLEADKAFSFYDFKTCRRENLDVSKYIEKYSIETPIPCHLGDTGIILDLYDYLTGNISGEDLSEIEASVKNHMLAFAAEDARLKGQVIDLKEYLDNYLNK
ncbi:MAG: Gfo/Idh/MocA family oxidoreductase [Clostridia bacterium]|nr:Gfo/Idh/MocA family oxidoreductase [Clostridia bacterium]